MLFKKSLYSKPCLIVIAAAALSACQSGTETKTVKKMTQAEMAENVVNWWPGDYNNDREIAALKADGAPIWQKNVEGQKLGGHLPVNAYYRKVDMPAFGDKVLYLEEFTFKENPYRQRIYTVIEDENSDQVRVKLWYFPDKTTYAKAWKDLSLIKDLTPDKMSPLPDNCDLYVTQVEDRLEMKMPRDKCKFGTKIFDYQVSLSADDYWYRDRIVEAETMLVESTAGSFQYHKLDKF